MILQNHEINVFIFSKEATNLKYCEIILAK